MLDIHLTNIKPINNDLTEQFAKTCKMVKKKFKKYQGRNQNTKFSITLDDNKTE